MTGLEKVEIIYKLIIFIKGDFNERGKIKKW
ncbi:Uncharacterised protein [[Clostridium] sordellii]|nr:Uncharacterised protein [[Clostridium] sordellii] [Paeniclostridium sordellii]CEP94232.1 Uncharacterised protein [[Clostridium] sordellii] [Paeniclostridium sordellii]CEQ07468.1 Uncharacterised protein [[Clostridium] sordellii] [Paeniclostridium sordellii]